MAVIEISLDSVASAVAADAGGAQRVELCSALREGGLTPSLGLIRAVRASVQVELHVIIRPRSGDFLYTADEFAIMRDDIRIAADAGADGVVLGLLTADGEVDAERTQALIEAARPMEVTFHRAFDMTCNLDRALEDVIKCGANRVLTSGGRENAVRGQTAIHRLVHTAAGRIAIMAGGGIRPENITELIHKTGASEFHSSLRRNAPSPMKYKAPAVHISEEGADEYARTVVLADDVRRLVAAAQHANRSTAAS